jgi:signal transduction histidine kinase
VAPPSKTRAKKQPIGGRLRYAARLTITFALIAIMTSLIAASMLIILWNQQFLSYSHERVEEIARSAAETTGQRYEIFGDWIPDTVAALPSISVIAKGTSIKVVSSVGMVVYNNSPVQQTEMPLATPQTPETVTVPVLAYGEQVGTISVTPLESTYLSETDIRFRLNAYQGIIIAAVVAVILATIVGLLFARGLVSPIDQITETVNDIKEGKLAARTEVRGSDEIAVLARTLNEMADSIEEVRKFERQLTTDVAHELRTPLMAMQATIEAIIDGVLPADQTRLATIDSEVVRLGRLVDALLRLSRLENRNVEFKEEEINLGELIAGLVLSHEKLIEDSELSIEFKADAKVIVFGDADLLRQATANLISNAVRYTSAGGKINVEVRRGQIMAQIIVADTGMGISEEDIKNVFSRFWRADAGRNRESGGLGVGLAVVKEIADRHNGWVNVESILGRGTVFTIYVPLFNETMRRQRARAAKAK